MSFDGCPGGVHDRQPALSRFLASRLDPVFKEEVRSRKKKVASTLLEQPPLSKLLSVIGVSDTEDEKDD